MIELDDNQQKELMDEFQRFARISGLYMQPFMDRAVRMYKIYNAIADAVEGLDEEEEDLPNIFLPYAYGIIENLVSGTVEPLFQLKPPCRVKEKIAQEAKQAEGFSTYMRNKYSESEYQMGYVMNTRESIITGWSWEKSTYAQRWLEGKKWVSVPEQSIVNKLVNVLGKLVPAKVGFQFNRMVEQDYNYEDSVGFEVRFPSVFDVFPEPGVRNVKNMHYLIEVERNVSLADLKKQFYADPKDARNKIPVFSLEKIEAEYANHKPGEIRPGRLQTLFQFDYGEELQLSLRQSSVEEQFEGDAGGDLDRIHLAHVYKPTAYYCIGICAKGDFIIAHKDRPFHKPRIPFHLKNYAQDNLTPFGISALQPIEHVIYEMNDVHSLSMQSFFQAANNMLLIKENAIVSWDDFDQRSGGKIRIKDTQSVGDVALPVKHTDGTSSMLAHESNSKGLMEWATGSSDLSPGVEGTKQTHETLGGLMEIQKNMGRRTSILRRQYLNVYQDQMYLAHDYLQQFQFENVRMESYDQAGKRQPNEFRREDLVMQEGPNLIIEYDPSYGDDSLLRNHLQFAMLTAMKYEDFRLTKRPDLPVANIAETFRRLLNSLGWDDTSEMLKSPDGVLDPDKELEMMLRGEFVRPNPKENLTDHHLKHKAQEGIVRQLIAAGKATPQVMLALQSHNQATGVLINDVLQTPDEVNALLQGVPKPALVGPGGPSARPVAPSSPVSEVALA